MIPFPNKVYRPSWDTYFLNIAKVVSERATCLRASVGAVFVVGNRVLTTGYNGSPPGKPHCIDVGCDVVDGHCQRAIHAECNAVAQAALVGVSLRGATLYLYDTQKRMPCRECKKLLDAIGVDSIQVTGEEVPLDPTK
ncbi:MAG: dCMP deaminase [Parcubacteria group bacterium]|nr:dCMP deaminase [Parcubacteria group bacterium]